MVKFTDMNKYAIYFIFIIFSFTINVNGQGIKKEVYVESSYKPEVADADKINNLPVIKDTFSFVSPADYKVLPSHLKTEYALKPIKPATMVGTPLDKLYNSYLKIGVGNYATPLAEFSIHNLRSKEYSVGAYFFHQSSYSDLKLDNGRKVPSGYGKNEFAGHGKYFFKNSTLSGNVGLNTYRFRFYGIDTNLYTKTIPNIDTKDIKQSFLQIYGRAKVYSTNPDTNSLSYSLGFGGDTYKDYFDNKEPHVNLNASLGQMFKSFRLGINASIDNYALSDSTETYKHNILLISPFLTKRNPLWELKIAGKLFIESGLRNKTYIFPDASLKFHIIEDALVMYFGIDGNVDNNSYFKITHENPYVLPGLSVKNTVHQWIAYGGLEGKLSSKASYKFDVRLDAMTDMYFFVNDTTGYRNHFDVVYNDADLIQYYGEISWVPLNYLTLFTKINYYDYRMTSENKPWHRQSVDYTFTARYNFKEKIYAEIDFLALSKRYAKNFRNPTKNIELDPVYDVNLKLEYKYSNILTGFLHFYNLTSQQYYLWNQYPAQRINIMLGITYKL
jgi:hypothetical protein